MIYYYTILHKNISGTTVILMRKTSSFIKHINIHKLVQHIQISDTQKEKASCNTVLVNQEVITNN